MLTGIPKLVLVAGYKEGILFSEFFIIKSILGISFVMLFLFSIFNNESLPCSSTTKKEIQCR